MTEEQFRLTLHAHRFVWVYGYNSREQLRDDLGTGLKKHVDLARGAVCYIAPIRPPFNRCICSFARVLLSGSKCDGARCPRVGRDTRGGHVRLKNNYREYEWLSGGCRRVFVFY